MKKFLSILVSISCLFTVIQSNVMAAETSKYEMPNQTVASFPDVRPHHYAYEAVKWAKKEGIVQGYENGEFGPDNTVTEAQFAIMLKNFFDIKTETQRLPKENFADDAYNSLAAYGVPLNGYIDHSVRNQPIKRGLVAQSLVYLGHDSLNLEKSIQFLLDEEISTGQNPDQKNNVLNYFGYANDLTRAQAVTFLYKMNFNHLNKLSESALTTYQREKSSSLEELAKQAQAKIHGDLRALTKSEAKKVVNELLSGIVGTFDQLGKKHQWSFENHPDFAILRPELLKYASEEFTDGFLKDVKDDFYCSCDVPPYPYTDFDIRFTLHENTSNRFVASSIEFDNMISSGSTVYYTVVKENGKWVLDKYQWVSIEKEPVHLTWEEVKMYLEKQGSKVELLNITKYKEKEVYIYKYAGQQKIIGMFADNSGYLLDVPSDLLP